MEILLIIFRVQVFHEAYFLMERNTPHSYDIFNYNKSKFCSFLCYY